MDKISLPIDSFKLEIIETIKKNPVTIIVADTGAGKSTRVPQFLLDETDYEIVVTQPRRMAAKSVAKRVAQEMECRFGGLVGFRTAVNRNDSVETRCLFATDGLQLVRELTAAKQSIGNGLVLIVDEVHEWNQNIETLVAWVKKAINEGVEIKVVLMSATLDHEKLSAFFNNAPVINVPGRCFPVIGSPSTGIAQLKASQMLDEIKRLVAGDRNTLVFLPGKGEITEMQKALQSANLQAVILPLHGEIDSAEQDRVFDSYSLPKVILSTNIAQTSVTIPDIDAVVDSGLERRIELRNGVETLALANISRADCKQRAGRAGRVREGEYVLCNDTNYSEFTAYPTPEILRALLDQMVLRLAGAGLDATRLPFYHQPDSSVLAEAKETLIAIEALDAEGKITKLGHKINKFPTDVKAARMILEAIEHKCLGPVLTIAAIIGAGGTLRRRKKDDDPVDFKSWMSLIDPDKKYQSDMLVELEIFWKAKNFRQNELAKNGIVPRTYGQSSEIRGQLKEALGGLGYQLGRYDDHVKDEVAILKSIAAGMLVHLYRHEGGGSYRNGSSRTLAKESIINRLDRYPEWIVGEPFNISFKNRRGNMQTIELVSNVTVVDPSWMSEIAPHLVTNKVERLYWSSEQNCVVEDHITIFNGQEIAREAKPCAWSTEAFKIFVNAFMSTYTSSEVVNTLYRANTETLNQYNTYYVRSGGTIPNLGSDIIREQYSKVLEPKQVLGFAQFESLGINSEELTIKLSDLISQEEIAKIEKQNPDVIKVEKKEFFVTYKNNNSFDTVIEVTEDFVSETKLEGFNLPSGRSVTMVCGNYSSTSVTEIKNKLEEYAISQAWSTRRSEMEKNSWIKNPEEVYLFLENLLKPIQIAVKRDGEVVAGFLSLYSDSDPDFQIRLRTSIDEATKETETGIVRLFQKSIKTITVVPQVLPWYDNGLTEMGQTLQEKLKQIVSDTSDITSENILEKIESVKTEIDSVKNQIQNEYKQAQVLSIQEEGVTNETVPGKTFSDNSIDEDQEEFKEEYLEEQITEEEVERPITPEDLKKLQEVFKK